MTEPPAASVAVAYENHGNRGWLPAPIDGGRMLIEVVGTAGAICLLIAYFLIATQRVTADAAGAHLLNLAGAGMLGANALHHGAYPPAALNVLWAAIALTALARRSGRIRA